jgi:hypothetical protein
VKKTLKTGTQTITDNWLLQDVVDLLNREKDPLQNTCWLQCDDNQEKIMAHDISFGAIAIQSFIAFLEQLVFCDAIYVLKDWTDAWLGKHQDLDDMHQFGYIKELDAEDGQIENLRLQYLNDMSRKPYISNEMKIASREYEKGNPLFLGQVAIGSSVYLALAENKSLVYSPHPVRGKFLQSELYYQNNWPYKEFAKFEELFRTARLSALSRTVSNSMAITLSIRMSSIALYCLLESSESNNPIKTACQLKNDDDFRSFRYMLHEIITTLDDGLEAYVKRLSHLEELIGFVEKKLGLKKLTDTDGFSQLNILGQLPVKVPKKMRFPLFRPKHSSIVFRLLGSHRKDLRNVLAKCFGIANPKVIKDLISLTVADK